MLEAEERALPNRHIADASALAEAADRRRCANNDTGRRMTVAATKRVQVIGPGKTYVGKQGFTYGAGASAETVGAQHICMNILPMPSGAQAKVHFHEGIETIAYLLEGACAVHYGDRVERRVLVHKGDQVFIPADVPHAPRNESREPCTWIVVHSAGSDQEGIVLLPELDAVLASKPLF